MRRANDSKQRRWLEATQYLQGSLHLILLLSSLFLSFLHALGTMHELSVGGGISCI